MSWAYEDDVLRGQALHRATAGMSYDSRGFGYSIYLLGSNEDDPMRISTLYW